MTSTHWVGFSFGVSIIFSGLYFLAPAAGAADHAAGCRACGALALELASCMGSCAAQGGCGANHRGHHALFAPGGAWLGLAERVQALAADDGAPDAVRSAALGAVANVAALEHVCGAWLAQAVRTASGALVDTLPPTPPPPSTGAGAGTGRPAGASHAAGGAATKKGGRVQKQLLKAQKDAQSTQRCALSMQAGHTARAQGNWDQCIHQLGRALEMASLAPALSVARAECQLAKGNLHEAAADAAKALKVDKGHLPALLLRARAFYRLDEKDVALRHIRQLLRRGLAAHHTIGVRRPTRELTAAAGRQDDRTTIKVSRVS
jgi:tetratricopeptide (TPR) repeat protein